MNKKTLICLHGFPFNKSSWDSLAAHLDGKIDVIAFDQRGHGTKEMKEPGPWMITHFAEDLKKLMDQRGLEKAVLCGVSMGGYVALNFVAQYPDRVAGLILSNTQAGADNNEAKDKRYGNIVKVRQIGVEAFAAEFAKNVLAEATLAKHPEVYRKVQDMILTTSADNIAMTLGALASRKDCTEVLPKIACPTLVIGGDQDKAIPPAATEKMAEGIKGSAFKKIEGVGHLPNLEKPDAFNRLCEEFLQSF